MNSQLSFPYQNQEQQENPFENHQNTDTLFIRNSFNQDFDRASINQLYTGFGNVEIHDHVQQHQHPLQEQLPLFHQDQQPPLQFHEPPLPLQYNQQQQQLLLDGDDFWRSRIDAAVRGMENLNLQNRANQLLDPSGLTSFSCPNGQAYHHGVMPSYNPEHIPFTPSPNFATNSYSFPTNNLDFQDSVAPPLRFQQNQFVAPLINHASSSSSYMDDQPHRPPWRQPPRLRTFSVEDMRGNIHSIAKTHCGCRKLQKIFLEGSDEEKRLIVSETLEHLDDLIVHEHGTELVQKVFTASTGPHISRIVDFLLWNQDNILRICQDTQGNRAIQQLLESIKMQRTHVNLILLCIKPLTLSLVNSHNGSHVIKKCFTLFNPEYMEDIANEMLDHCVDISKNTYGCCVMQECLKYTVGAVKQCLLDNITMHALELSKHAYGNYVVQYIIGMLVPAYTKKIVDQLAGEYVNLSQHKCGSHVVEKCILLGGNNNALSVIREIMSSDNFLTVIKDACGNYVVQKSLYQLKKIDKGLYKSMVASIQESQRELHSHPHGRRVLEVIRKLRQQMPPRTPNQDYNYQC